MKILYICYEYPPYKHGGIGSYTKTIAEQMVALGHEVSVLGVYDIDKDANEIINGVNVIRLKSKKRFFLKRNKLLNSIFLIKERFWFGDIVNKYVNEHSIDIVESHDFIAPIFTKIRNAKLIVRLHGSNSVNRKYNDIKKSILMYNVEKRGLLKADVICSVSEHIYTITKKTFKNNFKSTTIYNGVDLNIFYDREIQRDHNKMILVGRMHPVKGFDLLFEALNIVFEKNEDLYLDIICSINEDFKNQLLDILNKKYHGRVHFIGRINNADLPTYLSSANFSILPSRAEAFPITPLESMACGTPVLMNDKFSAREIIEDGADGWLIDCYNKEAFAEKILSISNNQHLIDEMREKCIDKIKCNFDIEHIKEMNVRFYEKVIKNEV